MPEPGNRMNRYSREDAQLKQHPPHDREVCGPALKIELSTHAFIPLFDHLHFVQTHFAANGDGIFLGPSCHVLRHAASLVLTAGSATMMAGSTIGTSGGNRAGASITRRQAGSIQIGRASCRER